MSSERYPTREMRADLTKFMRDFNMSKTVFGLKALQNPHTVSDFLDGKRTMTLTSADNLYEYMRRYKKEYDKNVSRAK